EFNRAGGSDVRAAVRQYEIRDQAGIGLLNGHRETGQTVGSRLIIRSSSLRAGGERQREAHLSPTHHPHTRRPIALLEEFETRYVGKLQLRRHRCDLLLAQDGRESALRSPKLAQESRRLLPLALFTEVGVVAASERKHRQQML